MSDEESGGGQARRASRPARLRVRHAQYGSGEASVQGRARARRQVRQGGDGGRVRRQRGDGRTIEDAMNAPEAPTEAPRPHSVRMDGHESVPN